jgi:hypothetical protein
VRLQIPFPAGGFSNERAGGDFSRERFLPCAEAVFNLAGPVISYKSSAVIGSSIR